MNRQRSALGDLDDLLISDHQTDGHPVLPEGSRERVEEKVARLIVTRELLAGHIRALRQRAGPGLRHAELLPEDLHEAVVLGSPSVLDDAWLARLALNPIALCALRDSLFELPDDLPGAWWAILEREGRDVPVDWNTVPPTEELLRRAGILAQRTDSESIAESPSGGRDDRPPSQVTPPSAPAQPILMVLLARPPGRSAVYRGADPEEAAASPGGADVREWVCTTPEGRTAIRLPSELARRCYGNPEQDVAIRLHRVRAFDAPGMFEPQLEVSPPPALAPLTLSVTFVDGQRRPLTVPVPRGRSSRATSQKCEPLPESAFGQDEWKLEAEIL